MRRALLVTAAFVPLLACATVAATPTPNVRGTLFRGPVTPVCVEFQPCDAPAPGVTLVFAKGGREAARVVTGRLGHFALRLAPGPYTVRTLRRLPTGGGLTPRTLRVPSAGVVRLALHLDTGIR